MGKNYPQLYVAPLYLTVGESPRPRLTEVFFVCVFLDARLRDCNLKTMPFPPYNRIFFHFFSFFPSFLLSFLSFFLLSFVLFFFFFCSLSILACVSRKCNWRETLSGHVKSPFLPRTVQWVTATTRALISTSVASTETLSFIKRLS